MGFHTAITSLGLHAGSALPVFETLAVQNVFEESHDDAEKLQSVRTGTEITERVAVASEKNVPGEMIITPFLYQREVATQKQMKPVTY